MIIHSNLHTYLFVLMDELFFSSNVSNHTSCRWISTFQNGFQSSESFTTHCVSIFWTNSRSIRKPLSPFSSNIEIGFEMCACVFGIELVWSSVCFNRKRSSIWYLVSLINFVQCKFKRSFFD
jgi:hypothetical protein